MTSSDLSIGVMRSLVGANPRDSVNGNTYSFGIVQIVGKHLDRQALSRLDQSDLMRRNLTAE